MLQHQSVWPGLGREMIKDRGCQLCPASSEAASPGVPASREGAFPQAGQRVNWIMVPVWRIRFTELRLASGSCCKDPLSVTAPSMAPCSPVMPVAGGHGPASASPGHQL
ncbi:uncharacterized protein WM294_012370 isoform 2-T2 [Sarcoramphus papa]